MYVTVDQVKEECATASPERIKAAIELAQAYIDKMTGQWFELRTKTFKFDGRKDKTIIFLPVFATEITEIIMSDTVLGVDDYVLYNRFYPDDRLNPKIVFEFTMLKGKLNIEVTGSFGYVEEDDTVPVQIQKICKKLALSEVKLLNDSERRDVIDRGRIIKEKTDDHSYELGNLLAYASMTGDPEIDSVLLSYLAPISIGAV